MPMPTLQNSENGKNKGKNKNFNWHEQFLAVPKVTQWHTLVGGGTVGVAQ
jgi:hypothetical protein